MEVNYEQSCYYLRVQKGFTTQWYDKMLLSRLCRPRFPLTSFYCTTVCVRIILVRPAPSLMEINNYATFLKHNVRLHRESHYYVAAINSKETIKLLVKNKKRCLYSYRHICKSTTKDKICIWKPSFSLKTDLYNFESNQVCYFFLIRYNLLLQF